MTCQGCGFANPPGMRFCGDCGQALGEPAVCGACGADLPAGFRFCGNCGSSVAPARLPGRSADSVSLASTSTGRPRVPRHLVEEILRSRSLLEGGRKQVTVLFADVIGSMTLAERLDPEDWAQVMQRLFGVLADSIERFEGFVDKFTGDGIMALFGAPLAREDHARRACYAALHLRDAVAVHAEQLRRTGGIDLAVRVGLNSGEVVVGTIGDDLRMAYTAQGHTVGLAQRMEALAAPQSICLSEATARLVSGYVDLHDLGAAEVKGASRPVRVFELVGIGPHRTHLDVARSRGLTRFSGREADLRTLEAALELACAGDGQVVGVVAEAGTGKSRLCLEFVERCRARGMAVSAGRCPAHGQTVPHLPLLELLRGIFGIGEGQDPVDARKKIARTLKRLDERFEDVLPIVEEFLGVRDPERPASHLGPDLRQRQLVAFIRQLIRARSARGPQVLMIDDAHWIDLGSDALLAHAVDAVHGTRTLVIVNFRPGYQAEWMSRSYYRQVPLLPLAREAITEMLGDLLGGDASVVGLMEMIHDRTRGNPFFVEEVVRSLVARGCLEGTAGAYRCVRSVASLEIPETVQALLAARIDRLRERDKRLLEIASVIGETVPDPVLARVAGLPEAERAAALSALVAGELLIERALFPQAEYGFKHPLTREVAYGGQLAARRAERHAAVARAIEEAGRDRLDELAPLLAFHCERAGAFLEAAGWSTRAAQVFAVHDAPEAIRCWQAARSLLMRAPESDEREQLELEACRGLLGITAWFGAPEDESASVFARGRGLADRRGDRRSLSLFHLYFGIWHGISRNDIVTFAHYAEEAARLSQGVGDVGVALATTSGLALVRYVQGRVTEAIALGNRAVPRESGMLLGAEYWFPPPVIWLQGFTGFLEGLSGRPAHALAELERILVLAQNHRNGTAEWLLRMWAVHQAELLGDAATAMVHATAMERVVRDAAGPLGLHYCFGVAHLLGGKPEEAARCLERALAIQQEVAGGPLESLNASSRLAVAYAELGRFDEALEASSRGLELVRSLGFPVFMALALTMDARVVRTVQQAAGREAVEASLDEAEALVQRTGIRGWQPFIHVERAELAAVLGDAQGREREMREAQRLFRTTRSSG